VDLLGLSQHRAPERPLQLARRTPCRAIPFCR
jgi:hypothetical protein